MDGFDTPSKIDLRFTEHKIVFLICDCSLDKKYSFWKLTREQAEKLIERLRYLEKLTWKQLSALDRKHGLTTEKTTSDSFAMIDGQNTSGRNLTEQYYFHFRVEKDGKFRVFGYQKDHYFCITHIDFDGVIHHS